MRLTLKQTLIGVLIVLAVTGVQAFDHWAALYQFGVAVVLTLLLDLAARYALTRKLTVSESALITGMIIGLVIAPGTPMQAVVLAAIGAVASKLLIVRGRRHVFNPAGFGLAASVLFLNAHFAWWGAAYAHKFIYFGIPVATVLLCGYAAYRAFRLQQAFSYVLTYAGLSAVYAAAVGANVLLYALNVNWFFALVMVIEPITSPAGRKSRMVFGMLAAVMAFAFTFWSPAHAEIFALMVANALVPAMNKHLR